VKTLDILNLDYFNEQNGMFEISNVFSTLGCKEIGIRKSKFVAKTQFLYGILSVLISLIDLIPSEILNF